MSAHTPGPWRVEERRRSMSQFTTVVSAEGHAIISEGYAGDYSGTAWAQVDHDPDAHLIAAAPDLLAELKELYATVMGECPSLLNEDSGGSSGHDGRIRAAIAKAEGTP